jgi:hypothetical protein
MLTLPLLFDSLRSLVIYSPEVKDGVRLNCFGIVERREDLSGDALGLQLDDYYEGYFWSREWVDAGASASSGLQKDYPLLAVEHKVVRPVSLRGRTAKIEVWLNVLDTKDCGGRLHEARTRETVYRDNINMLRSLLAELFTFQEYQYTKGANTYDKWASAGLTAALLGDSTIDSAEPTGLDFGGLSSAKEAEIFKNLRLNNDGAIAVTCKLEVEICLDTPTPYLYGYTAPEPKGVTAHKTK